MAQIYGAARLLPAGHPYLNPANIERYGIRHVVAEAGRNLSFKKENADQIVIYFMLLLGIALIILQLLMLAMTVFVHTAHAVDFGGPVPSTFADYFLVEDARHDLAFVLLDRVFGIPELFVDAAGNPTCVVTGNICFDIDVSSSTTALSPDGTFYTTLVANAVTGTLERNGAVGVGWPWPFHTALHTMFQYYSIGLLMVAAFIFLYFAFAVVAETAQSGTPFGRRFNHVWAPLRMVAAIGLLVPLTHGINSAQYVLLYAAKWGSGFATNGWVLFNNTAVTGGNSLLGRPNSLVSSPSAPPINTLLEFFTIAATCKVAYEVMYFERADRPEVIIDAWVINPKNQTLGPRPLATTNYRDALEYSFFGDIVVRFGQEESVKHQTKDGRIPPQCGEVRLQIFDVTDGTAISAGSAIHESYYQLIQLLWEDAVNLPAYDDPAGSCPYRTGGTGAIYQNSCIGWNIGKRYLPYHNDPHAPLPTTEVLEIMRTGYQELIEQYRDYAVALQQLSTEWTEQHTALGWGGAAIWYNKIAQLNGDLIGAVYSLPTVQKYPAVMETVRKNNASGDADMTGKNRHQVYSSDGYPVHLSGNEQTNIANALFAAQKVWGESYIEQRETQNVFIDIINMIFGTSGLFDMQRNAELGVHPLAQLTGIGKSVMESAINNLGISAGAGMAGGLANVAGFHRAGQLGTAASGFLVQVAMIGLSIGFVLFYVVPFLPFIYFFFAVGGWIKGIFEAMVGVPLWALAHMRIDGNGLPGDAAMGGYYLILEVFIRPILIVFGFIASIVIFAAQVHILHEIWPLVTSNLSGFDADAAKGYDPDASQTGSLRFLRGAVDKFFFTAVYAVVVYMIGMASFKMIDLVPNHVLRWMGANVSSFGDQSGDPAENLVRNSYMGSNMMTGSLGSAIKSGGQAASSAPAAVKEIAERSKV